MIEHGTLLDILLRHAPESRSFPTAIKGFRIARRDISHIIERCVLKPIVIVTVQGKKRTILPITNKCFLLCVPKQTLPCLKRLPVWLNFWIDMSSSSFYRP